MSDDPYRRRNTRRGRRAAADQRLGRQLQDLVRRVAADETSTDDLPELGDLHA